MPMTFRLLALLIGTVVLQVSVTAETPTVRLKELVSLGGISDNQLIGYGIVVGLRKTGDSQQTLFTAQSLTNMLQQMGITVNPTVILVRNTAAAMVTATSPPFAQPGSKIDVSVAAMGDAASLQGGMLLMTSLRGIDGQVYSVAQGPVVTGAFIAGGVGNTQTLNHPTLGRIPNGAIVERPAPSVTPTTQVKLQLNSADFMTAARIAEVVNHHFVSEPGPIAHADNSGLVSVAIPTDFSKHTTEFIAELEALPVQTDRLAKVVINERTGTIVMGKEVHVSPVAIMHGNLTVEIQTHLRRVATGAAVFRHHPGDSASLSRSERGKSAKRSAEGRRHGGRTGARPQFHRVHAARYHRDPTKPAQCGSVGIRDRSHLTT